MELAAPPASRRMWFTLGLVCALLGIAIYMAQLFVAGRMVTPWYTPLLGTLGILMMVLGLAARRTLFRWAGFVVLLFIVAGEWAFLLHLSKVPAYAGPAKAGLKLPAFVAQLADGTAFTPASLETGTPTILLFYRGRW